MILSGAKSDIQRLKNTQRGIVNAWCLKIKDSSDNPTQNNKIQILYQQNQQNQTDQHGRLQIKSQGNSRNGSNIRQNSNQIYKVNEQILISQQLSTRDCNSPIKKLACNNNITSDYSIQQPQLQKQRRPPCQLMHILQSKKKNIRQMFALQLNNNIQQDDKNKIQMQEIKEKLLRVSQERNKKINRIIFEENRNNQNIKNMINQNAIQQANSSQTQLRQKNNFQELNRNSQEFQDKKFKVFADYQSFLLNNNSSSSNNNNINYQIQNTYQTNSYRSQLCSQNSSTTLTQGQQPKQKAILRNIPSQSALNRVIKQSLSQIQQTQNQETNQNIIQVKRTETREQFQNQIPNSERPIQRAQSMIFTEAIGQQANSNITDQCGKAVFTSQNSMYDDNNSKIIFQNKSQDKIEDEVNLINLSSFTNVLPSDSNDTPIQKNTIELKQIQRGENNEKEFDDTLSKRIRQISNPSLRKKYKSQSNLIMRNFLKKEQIPQINGNTIIKDSQFFDNNQQNTQTQNNFVQFDLKSKTDQPKRKKNKRKSNQMSMGETSQTTEREIREGLSNQNKNQTPQQSGQNANFMSFSEFCNYQRQQQIFKSQLLAEQSNNTNLIIIKGCSYSPSKRLHSYQTSAIDQINNKQSQLFCKNYYAISPKIIQQNILLQNQNMTVKQTNQRPSSSLLRQNKDTSSIYKIIPQKQNTSPDCAIQQNRPGTAKLINSQAIPYQTNSNQIILINSQSNINSLNNAQSPSKNKFIKRVSSEKEVSFFNVGDLNSWNNSTIEENSQFEMI
ncbi:hypothetical protein ABPG72_018782 [Tetrahymena utriculariae]